MKKLVFFCVCILIFASASSARRKTAEERCAERFALGLEAYYKEQYGRAVGLFSDVRTRCIADVESPDSLYFFLGKSYLQGRKSADARVEFRTVVEEYPHSPFLEESMYLVAYSTYKSAPIIERDCRLLRRSMREFANFAVTYPHSAWADSAQVYIDTIHAQLLEKEMMSAEYYEIVDQCESAVIYYESIIENYAISPRIPEVRLLMVRNLIATNRYVEAKAQLRELEAGGHFPGDVASLMEEVNAQTAYD